MNLQPAITKATALLLEEAVNLAPKDTGELANSIQMTISEDEGLVYTNLGYAPYVEFGTGKYAVGGDGRPGYWVFVKGDNGGYKSENKERKIYTLAQCLWIKDRLIEKGIPAEDIWITCGQAPQPFMKPALDNKHDEIIEIFKKAGLEEVAKNVRLSFHSKR